MSDFSVNDPDQYPERFLQRGLDESEFLDYVIDLDGEIHIVRGAE